MGIEGSVVGNVPSSDQGPEGEISPSQVDQAIRRRFESHPDEAGILASDWQGLGATFPLENADTGAATAAARPLSFEDENFKKVQDGLKKLEEFVAEPVAPGITTVSVPSTTQEYPPLPQAVADLVDSGQLQPLDPRADSYTPSPAEASLPAPEVSEEEKKERALDELKIKLDGIGNLAPRNPERPEQLKGLAGLIITADLDPDDDLVLELKGIVTKAEYDALAEEVAKAYE